MKLQSFRIEGLFNRHKLDVPIRDNTLVLVGENGSGKSTILGILFAVLSQDWGRLYEMPFQRVELRIDGNDLTIDKQMLLKSGHSPSLARWRNLERHLGSRTLARITRRLESFSAEYWLDSPDALSDLAQESGVPMDYLFELIVDGPSELPRRRRAGRPRKVNVLEQISELVDAQILFLPTYRRIERDLAHIFPDIDARAIRRKRRDEFRRLRRRGNGHIELVEFGMEDVEEAFGNAARRMDIEFRADLNRLTFEYLRDVLRGSYLKADYAEELSASTSAVEAILKRVHDSVLQQRDIKRLKELISAIDSKHEVPSGQDVAAHFLSKLVGLHAKQTVRESPVESLADTCNRYLVGKRLRFDSGNFTLGIVRDGDDEDTKLPPAALSSGEKQIVSLFTHLYLSAFLATEAKCRYFVIIDEPELSISVDWQRMFLPDILSSEQCEGLVAVTHSPFIFENECSEYAHSIAEFMK